MLHLIAGQQAAACLVQTQIGCYALSDRFHIAGEHHRTAHAQSAKIIDGPPGVRLDHIGNHNAAGIFSIRRDMNNSACMT